MAKSDTQFKPGNQAAKGHGFGRPFTRDPEVEAEAIIEWAQRPDSIILYKFALSRGYLPNKCNDMAERSSVFREAYEFAKLMVASNREEGLHSGAVNQSAWNRYAGMYHKDLCDHERAERAFDIEHKAKLDRQSTATPEQEQGIQALMSQIKTLQDSAAKLASSNKSTETKS